MQIILWIALFATGWFVGANTTGIKVEKKETITPTPVQIVRKESDWQDLKRADDRLIASCSDNFQIVTDIFSAQAVGDLQTIDSKSDDLKNGAAEAERLAKDRTEILRELGY